MENVQRVVMLLKPDVHAAGQWRGGATLRLAAMQGGVKLSLQSTADLSKGCRLVLFSQAGLPIAESDLSGMALQTTVSGLRLNEIAGVAIICGDRFLLKSSGFDWPEVIARYRFAHAQPTAPPQPEQTEPETAPESAASEMEAMPEEAAAPPETSDTAPLEESGEYEPTQESQSETPTPVQQEEPCPTGIRQSPVDPFPGVFPGSEWVKISYPGPAGWWHYIFGRARVEGYDADVVGVPGDYSMAPPPWLDGFSMYVRCSSGDARGYWLMFQDAQTGQVLDINRFRHGG